MFEVMAEHSERYLYDFFRPLSSGDRKNIGLMGGWAAHLLLVKRKIKHVGSRDIDIFFNPKKVVLEDLIGRIEGVNFKPHSTFRWCKFVQISTGKELTEAESKKLPLHDVATIYFDVASPEKIDRRVMHVPVLAEVFERAFEFCEFKGLEIMTPGMKSMIEMKLASAPERGDEFKKAKDLADLFALLYYDNSWWEFDSEGRRISTRGLDEALVMDLKQGIDGIIRDGSLGQAATMLKVDVEVVIQLLRSM